MKLAALVVAAMVAAMCGGVQAQKNYFGTSGHCVREFPRGLAVPGDFLADALAEVNSTIDRSAAGGGYTGFSYTVVFGDRVLLTRSYGVVDRDKNEPVTEHTPFRVQSVTKIVTTLTALSLRDRGWARIDVPVATYIPAMRGMWNRFAPGSPPQFTMQDLAEHSSGLARSAPCDDEDELHPNGENPNSCNATYVSVLRRWSSLGGAARPPKQKSVYSNFGMALLGYAAAASQGISDKEARAGYVDLATSLVLQPLGMADAGFDVVNASAEGRLARAYSDDGQEYEVEPETFYLPSHGMYASSHDLAMLVSAAMRTNGPSVDAASGHAVTGNTMREATRGAAYYQHSEGAYTAIGMAWEVSTAPNNDPVFGPTVSKYGTKRDQYSAYVGLVPAVRLGVSCVLSGGPVLDPTANIQACNALMLQLDEVLAPAAYEELSRLHPLSEIPADVPGHTFVGKYFVHRLGGEVPLGPVTVAWTNETAGAGAGLQVQLPPFIPEYGGTHALVFGTAVPVEPSSGGGGFDGDGDGGGGGVRYAFEMVMETECDDANQVSETVVLWQPSAQCVGFLLAQHTDVVGVKVGSSDDCAMLMRGG